MDSDYRGGVCQLAAFAAIDFGARANRVHGAAMSPAVLLLAISVKSVLNSFIYRQK
jgi:hypothetical protein